MKGALLCITSLIPIVALAAWSASVTITPPTTFTDGSALDKPVVYIVYDADTKAKLYSTTVLKQVSSFADTTKCVYVTASEYDTTGNTAVAGTESDPSPTGCRAKRLSPPLGVTIK